MKRTLLTLLLTWMVQWMALATSQFMVVTLSSGNALKFDLDDKPVVTYLADVITISTAKDEIEYPLAQIKGISYEGIFDGMNSPTAPSKIRITHHADYIRIEGATGSETLCLYGIGGKMVKKAKPSADIFVISVSDLPAGVYIVKLGTISYKIIRK